MRLAHSIPQLILVASLGFAPSWLQEEEPKLPVGEQGYPWNKIGSKRNEELFKELVGAWQLTRIVAPELNPTLREETGVLLFTRDYASFEVHIGWNDPLGGLADWQFQSGTHKVTLDAQSVLQLTSMIGSAFNDEGELEFTPPGTTRAYRIELNTPRLVLTRVDTNDRFEFRRLANPSLDKEKDLYGRQKE